MSVLSQALGNLINAVGTNTALQTAVGNALGAVTSSVSGAPQAIARAKALVASVQRASLAGNNQSVIVYAQAIVDTANMPADVEMAAETVVNLATAANPKLDAAIALLASTITNDATASNSLISQLTAAQAKLGG